MRKRSDTAAATKALIRLGATYRDRRGTLVTAEDFEFGPRGRTGRVVVCAADGLLRFPRRWYCRATDLVEVPEQGDLALIPADGGPQP
jgi:hypothetical protein